jgi:putative FmdB family regulatory protein
MPIYEYRCRRCKKRFSVLTLRVSEKPQPRCDRCGGRAVQRLLSRVALPRSEEARLDALADPQALAGLDENDPKSVGRWMRKVGKEIGDESEGANVDEMVDELEAAGNGEEDD